MKPHKSTILIALFALLLLAFAVAMGQQGATTSAQTPAADQKKQTESCCAMDSCCCKDGSCAMKTDGTANAESCCAKDSCCSKDGACAMKHDGAANTDAKLASTDAKTDGCCGDSCDMSKHDMAQHDMSKHGKHDMKDGNGASCCNMMKKKDANKDANKEAKKQQKAG
jgi:hypothetical protein